MLKEYEDLIYKNEEEKQEVYGDVMDSILEYHPGFTRESALDCFNTAEANNWKEPRSEDEDNLLRDFTTVLIVNEGSMLFDLCAEKFGIPIWSRNKIPKNCTKNCPFGDVCQKYTVDIEGKRFCYGQLYYRKIRTEDDLFKIADSKDVKILNPKGKIILDLNGKHSIEDEDTYYYLIGSYESFVLFFNSHPCSNKFIVRLHSNNQSDI